MNIRALWRNRLAIAAISLITLLLGGCGPSAHDQQIEQRLAAAEAKAESAEKRAKRAEAAVLLGTPNAPAVEEPPAHDGSDGDDESSEMSIPDSGDNQDEPVGDGFSTLSPESEHIIDNQDPPAPNAFG